SGGGRWRAMGGVAAGPESAGTRRRPGVRPRTGPGPPLTGRLSTHDQRRDPAASLLGQLPLVFVDREPDCPAGDGVVGEEYDECADRSDERIGSECCRSERPVLDQRDVARGGGKRAV